MHGRERRLVRLWRYTKFKPTLNSRPWSPYVIPPQARPTNQIWVHNGLNPQQFPPGQDFIHESHPRRPLRSVSWFCRADETWMRCGWKFGVNEMKHGGCAHLASWKRMMNGWISSRFGPSSPFELGWFIVLSAWSDRFWARGAQKGRQSSTSYGNLAGVVTIPAGGVEELVGFFLKTIESKFFLGLHFVGADWERFYVIYFGGKGESSKEFWNWWGSFCLQGTSSGPERAGKSYLIFLVSAIFCEGRKCSEVREVAVLRMVSSMALQEGVRSWHVWRQPMVIVTFVSVPLKDAQEGRFENSYCSLHIGVV